MDLFKIKLINFAISNAEDIWISFNRFPQKIRKIYPISIQVDPNIKENIVICYDYKLQNMVGFLIKTINIFSNLQTIQEDYIPEGVLILTDLKT